MGTIARRMDNAGRAPCQVKIRRKGHPPAWPTFAGQLAAETRMQRRKPRWRGGDPSRARFDDLLHRYAQQASHTRRVDRDPRVGFGAGIPLFPSRSRRRSRPPGFQFNATRENTMIETKMMIGRYLDFVEPATPPGVFRVGDPIAFPAIPMTIGESNIAGRLGLSDRHSSMDRGWNNAPGKGHRNFHWLPYIPGALAHVPFAGVDIVTGPMTGCDIALVTIGGVARALHVGTGSNNDDDNTEVKNQFNLRYAAGNHVLRRFNPFRDWAGPDPARLPNENRACVLAVITATSDFHIVWTWINAGRLRIAGVQHPPGLRDAAANALL